MNNKKIARMLILSLVALTLASAPALACGGGNYGKGGTTEQTAE